MPFTGVWSELAILAAAAPAAAAAAAPAAAPPNSSSSNMTPFLAMLGMGGVGKLLANTSTLLEKVSLETCQNH
jgi:hypothetical protein